VSLGSRRSPRSSLRKLAERLTKPPEPLPNALLMFALSACAAEASESGVELPLTAAVAPAGFSAGPVADTAPADNPLTEARAQLGRRLFYEPALSRGSEIACASCHRPEHAFSDPQPVSSGVRAQQGSRNAPALVNLAWATSLFWDGRAARLETQVTQPIENPIEMDLTLAEAVEHLRGDASYHDAFAAAFGEDVTAKSLANALASFVRTLVSGASAYDRFLAGDEMALDASARRGEALFMSDKAGCFHCHPPGALTNDGYFNNGSFTEGGDIGRKAITGRSGDLGKFRVPGLRNVANSAPYFHDGSLATLEDVVHHYEQGGGGHPSTDPQIKPLSLSAQDSADLLAFLRALSDDAFLSDPRYRP
jgi:cytochrome c peroxidase